ncbi:hypothetical protein TDB9533_00217 [Thalassocella blandensis]|nr:hypothetical protein TDB9533_00217 [Thalassocella blandensis]
MKIKPILFLCSLFISSTQVHAEIVSIEMTNLTHGTYFAPLFLTAHTAQHRLFTVGEMASEEIQAMAEGGDISGLVTQADSLAASSVQNPAQGPLAPGASVMVEDWDTGSNDYLSVVAMLVPTNDGFVGLDSWKIPSMAGVYTVMLNGYDAGTEANDEIINGGGAPGVPGIPGNPGMNGGENASGVTDMETNMAVHIHRGVIGDTDLSGGISDLDARIHRWLNPVAKLVITVQ